MSMRFAPAQLEALDRARAGEAMGRWIYDAGVELLRRRGETLDPNAKAIDGIGISTWLREVASHAAGVPSRLVIKGL